MSSIAVEKKGHIAVVTINRPDAMNAFNYETLSELQESVEKLRTSPDVRVVIFTGAGEKAFSVGADLKERRTLSDEEVRRNVYKIGEVFSLVDQLPQPTIAAINGFAFGGGMELALSCDFRIAVSGTSMGLTETSLAIIPGAGGTQRLPRLIGQAKALELILTAKRLTSEEALNYGILTKVTEKDNLLHDCFEFAGQMLNNGPIALQQAKFAVKHGMGVDLQTGLQIERKAYEVIIPTEDRVEALSAFAEKRKPEFKGK
ncbi:enoyl-CoA hydratase/isomerase family protein [Cytobacillus firmus]|jgi:enoyl-CoA hydratase/carnithine racemase|uniref:Enoyl-CoA hydratase-related protein n=1 Tax=Cytobacillus firmus TaxID=1399 RepID=A0AA46P7F5_CYTFI|nr:MULTISPECIES: enoyl-CoA hydratase-related protein [Bacillaceae]KML39485.1 enoyl-CoA hydratase [Cytobacillus firmus]MBG9443236.1 enoyl-CoA hydratase [Cytobacillus firmus]MBG9449851.1 enoyl-CoA hydratase [Cytobacillus firmus]MBY6050809.1 enoyl-CoA hydratase/isomerase family protein [Cytobacillus firmus]MCS0651793.1 enoyl-CoA hydratase-related protein [Cytobacillus firmus]